MMTDYCDAVRVCLRVRPQIAREKLELCRVCTSVIPGEPQVLLGTDRAFTFDYVFDIESRQEIIYETCVSHLIDGCFGGYNATVLAYGQTGSGKTYTMGTAFDSGVSEDEEGIVPRAVRQLFASINDNRNEANGETVLADCLVEVQFIELYNEEILDLLCFYGCESGNKKLNSIKIHENNNGNIYLSDVTKIIVNSAEQTMQILKNGALNRTTASTNMNVQSSRSHAIFTLSLRQEKKVVSDFDPTLNEIEVLTSKFHFVDLAGSERLKRTGATGDRAREGININSGLLALGNVISALGDASKKSLHVPYRDSKLTRLLQDSLGGNSRTLMIACISPSDIDFVETLNTLKYANRARNIKNKVVVNQDRSSKLIHELRIKIQQLETELMEFRQGKRVNDVDGNGCVSDVYLENVMLTNELDQLRIRVKALQYTVENYRLRNAELTAKTELLNFPAGTDTEDDKSNTRFSNMVRRYLEEIEELKARLCESEATCEVVRKELAKAKRTILKPTENFSNGVANKYLTSSCYAIDAISLQENHSELPVSAERSIESQITSNGCGSHDNTDDDAEDDPADSDETEGSRQNLADLQNEINLKEQLIEQLESSQKRLHAMKQQYDEKLALLLRKIHETEAERDKALSAFGNQMQSQVATSAAEKVKIDYEEKLIKMRSELNRLKSATREHERLVKQQQENNRRLNRLQAEVSEMKNTKVSLMKKIKEDAKKTRDIELRRAKEAAQYQKDVRRRDIELRTLKIEKEKREAVLKRKQDEIQALRRVQTFSASLKRRPATALNNAETSTSKMKNSNKNIFSPKTAKQRLSLIERSIVAEIRKKQMVVQMEQELSRLLQERESLARKLDIFNAKKFDLIQDSNSNVNMPQLIDLNDQIENVKAKLDYVQGLISECQSQIVNVDESKEESDENSNNSTATCTNLDEANFLIKNLVDICVANGARCGQSESKARDLEIQLQQVQNDYTLNEKLLKHLIGFKPDDPATQDEITASETQKHADITSDVNLINDRSLTNSTAEISLHRCPSVKARRRTATPKELLFSDATTITPMRQLLSALKEGETPPLIVSSQIPAEETRNRFFGLDYSKMLPRRANSFVEQEKYAALLQVRSTREKEPPNRHNKIFDKSSRKMLQSFEDGDHLTIPNADAAMSRSDTFSRNSPYRSTVALGSGLSKENRPDTATPEKFLSPRLLRRQLEGKDVFSRLTASTTDINESDVDDADGSHVMEPYSPNDKPPIKNAPLLCTYVVHGHSKDVLSLAATDDFLFTGSKDRTVCLWDLEKCKKMAVLPNHPSSVNCLRYSASKRILFSASMSQVILWDIRSNERIKIFNSSGLTSDGDTNFDGQSSHTILQPGETPINQIELSDCFDEMLFTSVYNQIRVWDLRNFQAIGKLASATYNQKSEIWSLSLFHRKDGIRLATGGRDHYIKVFDLPNTVLFGSYEPKVTLQPPHYDGVTCLCSSRDGRYLFSGSRDRNIVRWDLSYGYQATAPNNQNEQTRFRSQMVKAHNQWILSMTTLPNKAFDGSEFLVSACRDGYMKLWKVGTCQLMGEIRAHQSAIHCMTINSGALFTASKDTTVGIWKVREDLI